MSFLNSILSTAATMALGKDQKEQASLLPAVVQMVNQYPGGLNGLLEAFTKGGLGAVVASWMGQGQKLAVESSQLEQVLGSAVVTDLSEKSGLAQNAVLTHLTTLLPMLVEKVMSNPELVKKVAAGPLDNATMMSAVLGMLSKK